MIYKIRIILDAKDDVFRDVEIKPTQNLFALHKGIKSAFSLMSDELSSFWLSNENWDQIKEIPLEDMSEDESQETMSDFLVQEIFEQVGDRMIFVYDYLTMWTFYVELLEIIEKKAVLNYPLTAYRYGNMPMKNSQRKITPIFDEEIEDEESDDEVDLDFGDFKLDSDD